MAETSLIPLRFFRLRGLQNRENCTQWSPEGSQQLCQCKIRFQLWVPKAAFGLTGGIVLGNAV